MKFEWPTANKVGGQNQESWSFEFPIASHAEEFAEPVKLTEAAEQQAETDTAVTSHLLSSPSRNAASVPLPGRRDAVDERWVVPDITVGHPPVFRDSDWSGAVSVTPQQSDWDDCRQPGNHQDNDLPAVRRYFSGLLHRKCSQTARFPETSEPDERSV